jgi:hypothetical protein
MGNPIDETGNVYGQLTVLNRAGTNKKGEIIWCCHCECGEVAYTKGSHLRRGYTKSCGCLSNLKKHRQEQPINHPLYQTWLDMLNRCYNKSNHSYSDYGGRGISVCPRWQQSFKKFLKDMGPKPSNSHSLDRRDNMEGYDPGNCRWATRQEQARNTRNNVYMLDDSHQKVILIREYAESHGVDPDLFYNRFRSKGWSRQDALQPKGYKRIL